MIGRPARILLVAVILVAACSSDDGEAQEPGASGPAASATPETAGPWSRGADLRTPRTEVAVAILDATIYAAGGFTADGEASDVVEAYDISADRWEPSTPLPEPLHHAGLAAASGRLYVIGGYRGDGAASAGVWSWAPGEDDWRREPPLPTARGALAVATVEVVDTTVIHAVGGATGFGGGGAELSDAHEAFVLARKRWSDLGPMPGPRDHLAAASTEGKLYVVGGRELALTRNQARLDIYDPLVDRWTRGSDMPTAHGGLCAAGTGGRIYVFGGEQPTGTFPQAEVFGAADNAWTQAPRLPTARHGLGCAAENGDRLYVVGGGPTPGLSVSGSNEILAVGASED
ncbi:MAG: Kelch repeat-containing protein [Actinomycetota bacterium]